MNRDDMEQEVRTLRREHEKLRGTRRVGRRMYGIRAQDGTFIQDGLGQTAFRRGLALDMLQKARQSFGAPFSLVLVGTEWLS